MTGRILENSSIGVNNADFPYWRKEYNPQGEHQTEMAAFVSSSPLESVILKMSQVTAIFAAPRIVNHKEE